MAGRVVVVGSINVDLVVAADHLPRPGETVLGGTFDQHYGGKGANQAVAAARAGASVAMIGAVGDDAYGAASLQALVAEGIDVTLVRRVPGPTGVAIIAVAPAGENQIVVAPGANAHVRPEDVGLNKAAGPGVLVTGLEIPMATAVAAVRCARDAGLVPILNPAPAAALPGELLELGAVMTPNQHEVVVAIGSNDFEAAIDELARLNRGPIVVTRGAAGAILADSERREVFPGFDARDVVDTTGAGDAFIGVLAAWLADGSSLSESIVAANAAGAMSATRRGAREGMARLEELRMFLRSAHPTA